MKPKVQDWSDQWRAWLVAILAVWLFFAPWFLGFASVTDAGAAETASGYGSAALNSWIVGLALLAVSLWGIFKTATWPDWVKALLGVWLIIAPWVLGFAAVEAAMWNQIVIGLLVLGLAAWDLWTFPEHGSHKPA